jgi:hypothetical protein
MDLKEFFYVNKIPTTTSTAYVRNVIIIGENPDVDTATVPENIWELGGLITLPTAATVATIVSSSTNDTAAGTGARAVLIEGLDANYKYISEVVALNGTTNVTSVLQFYRINHFRVISSGSLKVNDGGITATVDGNIITAIGVGESLAHTAVYSVAAEHTLYLTNFSMGIIRTAGAAYATMSTKVYVPSINTIINSGYTVIDGTQFISLAHEYSCATIPEKADYFLTIDYASANNLDVVVTVRGLLVNNAFITNIKGFE